ncbi:Gfo/Idh/MocA family oxidoreductase [Bacillus sp. JJ1566]|uniref:Gfo/Idh/MocA family protein n=1 Tax=Bacillus sp. JJ1566 TaxID=3122961 RepID=UPI002FFDD60D
MDTKKIRFGIIGCGLMGKEFASAVSRWCHLTNVNTAPEIIAVSDINENAMSWFTNNIPTIKYATKNYIELLENDEIDAFYCAVPHNLHKQIYIDIINSGKHLLGEKPFGINLQDNLEILKSVERNPDVTVRCSSEIPYFPGAYRLFNLVKEGFVDKIIDVEVGFWHSSDLDPNKPINWKRVSITNGEYGCMGDLGMHVLHLPLRLGWKPKNVRAFLSNIVKHRPNHNGELVDCDTWDNAILACDVESGKDEFPMIMSMKRIAPGHANTWFIKVNGMKGSVEFSTQNPKQLKIMSYSPGEDQEWRVLDVPHISAFQSITGSIFEFGFSDSILQMWAAFCEEIVFGKKQDTLHCVTPEETYHSHVLFTAALESQKTGKTINLNYGS